MTAAEWIVTAVSVYLLLGVPASIAVLLAGGRLDKRLRDSARSVRVLLLPGAVAVWPVVIFRFVRPRGDGP